jgi:hypothetical protein
MEGLFDRREAGRAAGAGVRHKNRSVALILGEREARYPARRTLRSTGESDGHLARYVAARDPKALEAPPVLFVRVTSMPNTPRTPTPRAKRRRPVWFRIRKGIFIAAKFRRPPAGPMAFRVR